MSTYFADCFPYSLIHKIYFKGKREYDPEFQKSNETKISSEFRFFEIMERVLDPGTEYTVYMTASTSNGEGNRSDSITINTPAKGERRSVNLIVNLHIALFPLFFFYLRLNWWDLLDLSQDKVYKTSIPIEKLLASFDFSVHVIHFHFFSFLNIDQISVLKMIFSLKVEQIRAPKT